MSNLFSIIILIVSLSLVSNSESKSNLLRVHPFFAATCIAQSGNCNWFYERWSGYQCRRRTVFYRQPTSCFKMACWWCREFPKRSQRYPCGARTVVRACRIRSHGPYYTPKPKYQQQQKPRNPLPKPNPSTPKRKCTWTGYGNKIVIDLGKVRLGTGWDRVRRNGMTGIIFKRSPAPGISPPGKYGRMCFNVRAPMKGNYYFTSISYAPHVTEHNDVWVQSSKGFQLWQRGRFNSFKGPNAWLKAYQNNGLKGMSEMFKHIDFNGHRFIIPNVQRGERFRVCIAGRSRLYELYKLVMVKCRGIYCRGGIMRGLMYVKSSWCM